MAAFFFTEKLSFWGLIVQEVADGALYSYRV
jgi:hypothetical protein